MKVEIDFSVRGDVRKVERSTMRAYILKELKRRDNNIFSEILQWKGKIYPVSISWKEHETNNGRGASFWVSVTVKESEDLTSAFKMALRVKEVVEKGLGKEAMKYKDTISKLLKGYNGRKKKRGA